MTKQNSGSLRMKRFVCFGLAKLFFVCSCAPDATEATREAPRTNLTVAPLSALFMGHHHGDDDDARCRAVDLVTSGEPIDTVRTLQMPMRFAVPAEAMLLRGSAEGTLLFTASDGADTRTCQYTASNGRYTLASCSDGQRSGDRIAARTLALRIEGGTAAVQLSLREVGHCVARGSCPGGAFPNVCGSYRGVDLIARRTATASLDATSCTCEPFILRIPTELSVVAGKAGRGIATLAFRDVTRNKVAECRYRGTPRRGDTRYLLDDCDFGYFPRVPLIADYASLRVVSGDPTAGDTVVSVSLGGGGARPLVQEYVATDPRIAGAAIAIARGATSEPVTFDVSAASEVVTGAFISPGASGDSRTGIVAAGYGVLFAPSNGADSLVFAPTTPCTRVTLPYDRDVAAQHGGAVAAYHLVPSDATHFAIERVAAAQTLDAQRGTVSFCAEHASIYVAGVAPQQVQVTGTLTYADGNVQTALREAQIELWLWAPRFLGIWTDERVAVLSTDANGRYVADIPYVHRLGQVSVRAFATNPAAAVMSLQFPATAFYAVSGTLRQGDAPAPLDLPWHFADHNAAGHFNLADALRIAFLYASEHRDPDEADEIGRVLLQPLPGNSYYNPLWSTIYLDPSRMFHDRAIIHEYGHFLQQRISGLFHAQAAFHDGCKAELGGVYYNSPEYAWMEGFASYFSGAVRAWWPLPLDESESGTLPIALMERWPVCGMAARDNPLYFPPRAIESHVAAALWDMVDRAPSVPMSPGPAAKQEAFDDLAGRDALILGIFDRELDTPDRAPTFADFEAALVARGVSPRYDILRHSLMGVGYDALNDAERNNVDIPLRMTAGQTYPVSIGFFNAGTLAWDSSVYLANASTTDWGTNAVGLDAAHPAFATIRPGNVFDLEFTVTAPTTPGTYPMDWTFRSSQGDFGDRLQKTVIVVAETCNGADDDFDGVIDNGNPGGGQACALPLAGVCGQGVTECAGGTIVCQQTNFPARELCNSVDDDCDGTADEFLDEVSICNTGIGGICDLGLHYCSQGQYSACYPQLVQAEICDDFDNDCDGAIDGDHVCLVSPAESGVINYDFLTANTWTVGPRNCGNGRRYHHCTAVRVSGTGDCQVLEPPSDHNPDDCRCTIITHAGPFQGGQCAWQLHVKQAPL